MSPIAASAAVVAAHAGKGHQQFHALVNVAAPGQLRIDGVDLGLYGVQQAQVAVEQPDRIGVELLRGDPVACGRGRHLMGTIEQPLRQGAAEAIHEGRALADHAAAADGPLAQVAGGRVGLPDFGEISQPEQVRQDGRIDFVGFDFGLGDQPGGHGIGDHDLGHERLQGADHGPGVGGGFQGHAVVGFQARAADVRQGGRVDALVTERVEHVTGRIDDVSHDQVLVKIDADVANHVVYSL